MNGTDHNAVHGRSHILVGSYDKPEGCEQNSSPVPTQELSKHAPNRSTLCQPSYDKVQTKPDGMWKPLDTLCMSVAELRRGEARDPL